MPSNRLEQGQFAPRLNTKSIFGKTVCLETMSDHKIWMAFYRYATCPLCEIHLDDVITQANKLKEWDIRFIAVFESEIDHFPERLKKMDHNHFFMVSDKIKFLYSAFGVENSWLKTFSPSSVGQAVNAYKKGFKNPKLDAGLSRIPAHFLIAPGGQIYEAHYGRAAGHHIPWSHVKKFAETTFQAPEIELDA